MWFDWNNIPNDIVVGVLVNITDVDGSGAAAAPELINICLLFSLNVIMVSI